MKGGDDLRKYDLEDRLVNFAVKVTKLIEVIPKTKVGNQRLFINYLSYFSS